MWACRQANVLNLLLITLLWIVIHQWPLQIFQVIGYVSHTLRFFYDFLCFIFLSFFQRRKMEQEILLFLLIAERLQITDNAIMAQVWRDVSGELFKKLRNLPQPKLGSLEFGGPGTSPSLRAHTRTRSTPFYCTCQKHFKGTNESSDWLRPPSISGVARQRENCSSPRTQGNWELAYLHCRSDVINLLLAAAWRAEKQINKHPPPPQLTWGPRKACKESGCEGVEPRGSRDARGRCWACSVREGIFVRRPFAVLGSPVDRHPLTDPYC